jgi:hypothetical protein
MSLYPAVKNPSVGLKFVSFSVERDTTTPRMTNRKVHIVSHHSLMKWLRILKLSLKLVTIYVPLNILKLGRDHTPYTRFPVTDEYLLPLHGLSRPVSIHWIFLVCFIHLNSMHCSTVVIEFGKCALLFTAIYLFPFKKALDLHEERKDNLTGL